MRRQIIWWWGEGGEQAAVGNGLKQMPSARIRPHWSGGHDVRCCNNQHDLDLMPDSLCSIQTSCLLLINWSWGVSMASKHAHWYYWMCAIVQVL